MGKKDAKNTGEDVLVREAQRGFQLAQKDKGRERWSRREDGLLGINVKEGKGHIGQWKWITQCTGQALRKNSTCLWSGVKG